MNYTTHDLLDQGFDGLYQEAPKWKRLVNYILDLVFLTIGFVGFLFVVGFGTALADPLMPQKLESYVALLFVVWLFVYYLGSEWLFNGRTLAKFFTGTRAIGAEGNRLTSEQLLLRTLCRLIPLDNFSYLFSKHGWHDTLAGTRVVQWHKTTP